MYLNEKKIKLLQTKNILFICFGVFEALFSGSYIVSEFVMYRDNLYTAWHAKSMASSILFFYGGFYSPGSCVDFQTQDWSSHIFFLLF